jgi:type I restriction enzyme S subunit
MPQNIGDNRVIETGIARITPADAQRLSRYLVREGDIVYSRRGDVERRALVRRQEDGWLCGTGCLRIRLGEGSVNPEYASFYLGHPRVREWIRRHAHGATMLNLNTSILASCPFVIPSPNEQQAIAHILGSLEDQIELNRIMSESLEGIAGAIFKSWFIDFDIVRAKMDARDLQLPESIASLFPSRLEESRIGRIPQGWTVKKLGDLMELAYGKALKEKDRNPGSVPVFGSNGQVGWHDKKLVDGPGIVVGRKGNPGIVTWAPTDFFAIDTSFYVVPKDQCRSLYFLFYALKGQNLASLAADSAVPGLNRNLAYMSLQLVPPVDLLDLFDRQMRSLFKRVNHAGEASRSLVALRDVLLPSLVSGALRVPNPARITRRQV